MTQPPTPEQQYPYAYGVARPPNHPRAVPSLVLGILSLVLCGFFTGIPAMVMGRQALREIRASGGALGGEGMAKGGFWTGLVSTVWTGLVTAFVVVVFVFGAVLSDAFDTTCSSVNGQPSTSQGAC
jgi:ABC-type Fe3+ transport system permease subunit